jgi:hypothetical protein
MRWERGTRGIPDLSRPLLSCEGFPSHASREKGGGAGHRAAGEEERRPPRPSSLCDCHRESRRDRRRFFLDVCDGRRHYRRDYSGCGGCRLSRPARRQLGERRPQPRRRRRRRACTLRRQRDSDLPRCRRWRTTTACLQRCCSPPPLPPPVRSGGRQRVAQTAGGGAARRRRSHVPTGSAQWWRRRMGSRRRRRWRRRWTGCTWGGERPPAGWRLRVQPHPPPRLSPHPPARVSADDGAGRSWARSGGARLVVGRD